MKKFWSNLTLILLALLLSIALFYFTENYDFFSASILSLQDAETMRVNSRDIGYKNENKILDVFLSEDISNINYLSISIIYDDQEILVDLDQIVSQVNYEVLSNVDGNLILKFLDFVDFDYKQSLFELPFDYSIEPSILLGESIVVFSNGERKALSVGLLSSNDNTYH